MYSYINFKCLLCIHKYVAYSNIPNFLNYPYGLLHTFEHKSFFFINLNCTFIFFFFLLKHTFYTLMYTSYSLRIRHISYICVRCYNIIAGYGLTIEFYASITSFIHQLQLSFIHSCFIITTWTAGRKLCPLLLFTYIITFFVRVYFCGPRDIPVFQMHPASVLYTLRLSILVSRVASAFFIDLK